MTGDTINDDMTANEVVALLRRACAEAGSQTAWADAHGVSYSYVNDVIQGRRLPGAGIAHGLGLARMVVYRPRDAA